MTKGFTRPEKERCVYWWKMKTYGLYMAFGKNLCWYPSRRLVPSFSTRKNNMVQRTRKKLQCIDIAWYECKRSGIATCIKKVIWIHAEEDFVSILTPSKREMTTDELTFILRSIVCQTNLEPSLSCVCWCVQCSNKGSVLKYVCRKGQTLMLASQIDCYIQCLSL